MGRNKKEGFSFFPMDTKPGYDIEILMETHDKGLQVLVTIWQMIYAEKGYYLIWDRQKESRISRLNRISSEEINAILETCFQEGIFDKSHFDTYSVLTGYEIQKNYVSMCESTKRIVILSEEIRVNQSKSDFVGFLPVKESKVKEKKEKETKEKESGSVISGEEIPDSLVQQAEELFGVESPQDATKPELSTQDASKVEKVRQEAARVRQWAKSTHTEGGVTVRFPNPVEMPFPGSVEGYDWLIDLMEVWSGFRHQPGDGIREINEYRNQGNPDPETVWKNATWYLAMTAVQGSTFFHLKNWLHDGLWKDDWETICMNDEAVQKKIAPILKHRKIINYVKPNLDEIDWTK